MLQFKEKENQTSLRSHIDVCFFKTVSPVLSCKQTSNQFRHYYYNFGFIGLSYVVFSVKTSQVTLVLSEKKNSCRQ